ncbi:hypothetical protein [Sphingomonas radiodurans]|uniref:hypothetical protein n=1 Tax=Sphingomonas radiodurans TaxID=2890321 RepID=UPI001E4DAAD7|nr:hypothetical protein [Sphingomonas radiodurans]WBH17015.1 hypothetical protein LLW23_02530 [Sphingomonas radiodurans]
MITGTMLLAALLQVTPPVAVVPSQPAPLPLPPADLTALPELPLTRRWPEDSTLSDYVRDEILAGRCSIEGQRIQVDLAVLVAGNGQIRRVTPRAIQCPTVEQYASGVMSRMARGNVAPPGEDRWYRTALVFAWR